MKSTKVKHCFKRACDAILKSRRRTMGEYASQKIKVALVRITHVNK